MKWIALLLLAACAPRPDVGPLPPAAAAPPVLLPQAEINARIGKNLTGPSTEGSLDARAAALRARAAALR